MSDNYRSENPPLEPTVALIVNAGSLEFTVSYVIDYTKRTAMKDRLFTKVAEEVSNSDGRLQWASSAVTLINQPAARTRSKRGGHPRPPARAARASPLHTL